MQTRRRAQAALRNAVVSCFQHFGDLLGRPICDGFHGRVLLLDCARSLKPVAATILFLLHLLHFLLQANGFHSHWADPRKNRGAVGGGQETDG